MQFKYLRRWFWKLQAVLLAVFFSPVMFAYPAHYFVVDEAPDGALSIVSHQLVELSGAPEKGAQANAGATRSTRLKSYVNATTYDKSTGAPSFSTTSDASPWLRGEFAKSDGTERIDAHVFPVERRQYVVRVPSEPGQLLRLSGTRASESVTNSSAGSVSSVSQVEIDLDRYLSSGKQSKALAALPPGASVGVIANNGDSANRLDLLIVAEGYTAAQQSKFVTDASALSAGLLSISPYSDFRQLINVKWLFVPSAQSGADKPACAETPGSAVVTVDTAFNATFCTSGIRRLVTADVGKVLSAAAAVPDWDKALLLVNDDEYGGSGGSVAIATVNASSVGIMQHEFGHSFTLLADEYSSAFPGFPACSDINTQLSRCEPNVTDQTVLANLKWARWILPTTAIPTDLALSDPKGAGLWLGARYLTTGMYRQCFNGMMRALGRPFCNVDSEAFVKRLFGGWNGLPANGVSLINPDSIPLRSNINFVAQSSVQFQATLSGSLADLTATWFVDNVVRRVDTARHGDTLNFSYPVVDTASHTIELRVSDNTIFTLDRPTSSRIWNVKAGLVSDLSGDVKSDIVYKDASGIVGVALMNGVAATASAQILTAGSGWSVSHIADFNGDGKADLLIKNIDGRIAVLLMNGTSVLSFNQLLAAGTGYTPMVTGDFNGDGKADIIVRNTDGSAVMLLMNGGTATSAGYILTAGSPYNVTHSGDFNGDGKADLIIRNNDGSATVLLMNGLTVTSAGLILGSGSQWSVSHLADLNGDGKTDILIKNTDGSAAMLIMNGTSLTSAAFLLTVGSPYSVSHTGDFNGDGKADILIKHSDGSVVTLLMNGTTVTSAAFLLLAGSTTTVAQVADYNGDGKSDILLRNADGSATAILMNGTAVTGAGNVWGAGTVVATP